MTRYTINAVREDGSLWKMAESDTLAYARSDLRGYFMCNQGHETFILVDTETNERILTYEAIGEAS